MVGLWKALYVHSITILWENKLSFKHRDFIHHSSILAVKRVELVSDRMTHIVMRGCRWDLALIVHETTANINCDSKDKFHEELKQLFYHFTTYHMQILLGCCKAKYGREDRFKPTAGKVHIVWINQTLGKRENTKDSATTIYRLQENLWFI